jgi:hypothetical protein
MLKIKFNDGSEFIYHNQRFEFIDFSNLDKIALVSPAHRSQEGYAYISNKAPIRYSLHRYDENNLYHLVYSKSSYVLQAIFAPILKHKFQHTRTTEISSHSQSSFIHSGKQKIEDILNHAVEPYDKSKEYCIAIHWLNEFAIWFLVEKETQSLLIKVTKEYIETKEISNIIDKKKFVHEKNKFTRLNKIS